MSIRHMAAGLAALALTGAAVAWASLPAVPAHVAQDQEAGPTTRPGGREEQSRRRTVRITYPWSQLTDLSARQEAEIREIRRELLEKRDELDRQERERILAVLTEAQRARVAEIEEERARRQQERNEQARENRSTTRPAGSDPGPD